MNFCKFRVHGKAIELDEGAEIGTIAALKNALNAATKARLGQGCKWGRSRASVTGPTHLLVSCFVDWRVE